MDKKRYDELYAIWVINWCWGHTAFNFDTFFEENIEKLPEYLQKEWMQLKEDIKYLLCGPHDVRFENWNTLFHFYLANFIFAYWLFKLTHWTTYTNRIVAMFVVYWLLNKYWRKFFNFWKKKYISIK